MTMAGERPENIIGRVIGGASAGAQVGSPAAQGSRPNSPARDSGDDPTGDFSADDLWGDARAGIGEAAPAGVAAFDAAGDASLFDASADGAGADAGGASQGSAGEGASTSGDDVPHAERYWVVWWVFGLSVAAMLATAFKLAGWPLSPELAYTTKGFALALAFVAVFVSALSDSATRRIPNVLTYPAILLGLALNLIVVPTLTAASATQPFAVTGLDWLAAPGLISAMMGFMACAGIGIISFMFRGLGGGDVKIVAALGAILGFAEVMPVLFNALVFACLIGVVNLAFQGGLVRKIQAMSMAMQVNLALRKKALEVYPFGKSEAPFGVALLLGLITAQWAPLWEPVLGLLGMGSVG